MPPAEHPDHGYFRFPSIAGDAVAFVCEDDAWLVPAAGGSARRVTANLTEVSRPRLSRDGRLLAVISREEHHPEVWCIPVEGGPGRRLTWLGGTGTSVLGWTPDGRIAYASNAGQPFRSHQLPYAVDPATGTAEALPFGPCVTLDWADDGAVVLGRHNADPARWKRYRGGTAGQIWVDRTGSGSFKRILTDIGGNLAAPVWVGRRVYFVSDHEGIGNLYSCRPNGTDIRRHTDHDEFYVRHPASDGARIVYQHAAEIWVFDPADDSTRRIEIAHASPQVQRHRRFVPAEQFLGGYAVHPRGRSLAVETRGQLFSLPLWEGPARPAGPGAGVRHRLTTWLRDGLTLLSVSDETGEDRLVSYADDGTVRRFDETDVGFPLELAASPTDDRAAVATSNGELLLVDLDSGATRRLDAGANGHLADVAWSPDGRWLAYSLALTTTTTSIRICRVDTGTTHDVTRPEFVDQKPAWSPDGSFLFFLSHREFDPVMDDAFFALGFPRTVRPLVVPLRADGPSPFQREPRDFVDKPGDGDKKEPAPLVIDLPGIERRAVEFPVPIGRYVWIAAVPGKVLLLSHDVEGTLARESGGQPAAAALSSFDLTTLALEPVVSGVSAVALSSDSSTLVYRTGERLRAIAAGGKPPEGPDAEGPPSRKSGWLDLGRLRVSVDPVAEWRQMYAEAWRLQREYFWTPDMSGVDWLRVYDRYLPLLAKVASRSEFSDLMWEMQGELGTSHAYEMGGDYRPAPGYALGHLGADLELDAKGRWRIAHIVRADHWNAHAGSPLEAPGVGVAEGDVILAVNGRPVGPGHPPQRELVHQAGLEVELTVSRGRKSRRVVVRTVPDEAALRYREWVETNRRLVHERTDGRIGYLHVPDMGTGGYSEFHRAYLAEVDRDGLVVDVRDNSGGFVSGLLLERLARKRIGYVVSRHGPLQSYPAESPSGPLVCLTNQNAGSDGDIFTHCFKLMGLGQVVGTRTWGGVIGISPRHRLVDGGLTTQPTASFWFVDVGWQVENYGTDPGHVVDISPQEWAAGADPQLDRALALVLRDLKAHRPQRPDRDPRPQLTLPTLPPRG